MPDSRRLLHDVGLAPLRWLIALTRVVACVGCLYLRDGNGTYKVSGIIQPVPEGSR